jgi:hypothetical protein
VPNSTPKRQPGLALFATAAAILLAAFAGTGSASAREPLNKEDFKVFSNCPAAVSTQCVYGETLSGGFKMGSKNVPITNPVILQGGLDGSAFEPLPLLQPLNGAEAVSASSQPIPGGLTGISEIIGGPVSATAEVAGPSSVVHVSQYQLASGAGTGVELPIKVHLENVLLGEDCYIGSDAEPIVLHLTTGTTSPPAGTAPIAGSLGTVITKDKSRFIEYKENSLVDNAFAVPAATGCGIGLLAPVITAAVNLDAGLPSAAGKNVAELDGNLFTALAPYVAKYDKQKKAKKS